LAVLGVRIDIGIPISSKSITEICRFYSVGASTMAVRHIEFVKIGFVILLISLVIFSLCCQKRKKRVT